MGVPAVDLPVQMDHLVQRHGNAERVERLVAAVEAPVAEEVAAVGRELDAPLVQRRAAERGGHEAELGVLADMERVGDGGLLEFDAAPHAEGGVRDVDVAVADEVADVERVLGV